MNGMGLDPIGKFLFSMGNGSTVLSKCRCSVRAKDKVLSG